MTAKRLVEKFFLGLERDQGEANVAYVLGMKTSCGYCWHHIEIMRETRLRMGKT